VIQLERVDQAETVAAFLQGEIDSERFGASVRDALARAGADEAVVREPDLADTVANALRRDVLVSYRGPGRYLGDWFDELEWSRVALEPDEVLAVRYIAWDYWLEVTGGTRLPLDGAAYYQRRGEDDRYVAGGAPLIAARADRSSHLVLLEGHGRLTALAMHPEEMPRPLEILLGEGEAVRRWSCY
jgi:hypothetical protein